MVCGFVKHSGIQGHIRRPSELAHSEFAAGKRHPASDIELHVCPSRHWQPSLIFQQGQGNRFA